MLCFEGDQGQENLPVSTEWLKYFYGLGNFPTHPLAQAQRGWSINIYAFWSVWA